MEWLVEEAMGGLKIDRVKSLRECIEEMSSLSELIVEFRKSLHDDIDRALDVATRRLLFGLIDQTVNDTQSGMRAVHYAIESLTERVADLQRAHDVSMREHSHVVNASTVIPEFYHTNVELSDVVAGVPEHSYSHVPMPIGDDEEMEEEQEQEQEQEEEAEEEQEEEEEGEEEEVVDDETVDEVEEAAEVVDDETVDEVEEAEAVEEEEEEEETEEAEAVEEAAEEGLQELEVDGTTYYYDSEGNVYQLDADGEATGPVGRYNEEAGEFELFETEEAEAEEVAEEETLEEFTHKGKTYYKDSSDNVYNTDCEPLPYSYTNGRFVKHAISA